MKTSFGNQYFHGELQRALGADCVYLEAVSLPRILQIRHTTSLLL